MEAKHPSPIPPFEPSAAWCNVTEPVTLAGLQGRLPLLDFFTFCCVNCHHVLPELHALEERFGGRGLVVLGVHSAKFDHEKDDEQVWCTCSCTACLLFDCPN